MEQHCAHDDVRFVHDVNSVNPSRRYRVGCYDSDHRKKQRWPRVWNGDIYDNRDGRSSFACIQPESKLQRRSDFGNVDVGRPCTSGRRIGANHGEWDNILYSHNSGWLEFDNLHAQLGALYSSNYLYDGSGLQWDVRKHVANRQPKHHHATVPRLFAKYCQGWCEFDRNGNTVRASSGGRLRSFRLPVPSSRIRSLFPLAQQLLRTRSLPAW